MKSQQVATDRLKKDAAATQTKSDESQKQLQTEIQRLKEIIETINRESTQTEDSDKIKKLQVKIDVKTTTSAP